MRVGPCVRMDGGVESHQRQAVVCVRAPPTRLPAWMCCPVPVRGAERGLVLGKAPARALPKTPCQAACRTPNDHLQPWSSFGLWCCTCSPGNGCGSLHHLLVVASRRGESRVLMIEALAATRLRRRWEFAGNAAARYNPVQFPPCCETFARACPWNAWGQSRGSVQPISIGYACTTSGVQSSGERF